MHNHSVYQVWVRGREHAALGLSVRPQDVGDGVTPSMAATWHLGETGSLVVVRRHDAPDGHGLADTCRDRIRTGRTTQTQRVKRPDSQYNTIFNRPSLDLTSCVVFLQW